MTDHDRLFKELLTAHAWEFIELLMPEVAAYLEKDSLQLADKELFADVPGAPRQEADLVFRGQFKGQDRKKMRFLSGFIDNYLRLSAEETVKLSPVERGKVMEMTTSWKEEGRQEGQLQLMERLLRRQCGTLSKAAIFGLQDLPSGKLEQLADALLDFKSPEDLAAWLYQHA